ncbi:MAG: ATP-binding protein [Victivallaceae bacterium]|nr:ATP-binding protein [Victivallaceae bacterium]
MIKVNDKIFSPVWRPLKYGYLTIFPVFITPPIFADLTAINNNLLHWIFLLVIIILSVFAVSLFYFNRKKMPDPQTAHGSFWDGKIKNDDFAGEFQRSILLRDALASADAGYWEGNFILNKANASSKLYEIFGLSPDNEFVYETGTRVVHPDDNERVHIEISARLMIEQQPIKYNYRIITPQGKIKYVEAYTQVILDENKHATGMYGIIKDISQQKMLEYSLFENDDFEQTLPDCVKLVPTPFNFAMMINDIQVLLSPFAEKKEITLKFEQPDMIIPILDEAHLKQVIMGLTDNAIKFTDHGEVKISISYNLEPDSNIGEMTIVISDTGSGISSDKLDKLFELKEPNVQKKQQLGLIFAQQTIIAMGGIITVDSTPGKGSAFTIHIPHVSFIQPLGKIVKSAKRRSVYFEPAMVLTTGNVKYIQNMLAFVLLRVGLYPVPVDSAKEALKKMEEPDNNIALAIIDTGMQDMDRAIIKKLYRCSKKSNIPLLATVNSAEAKERFADDFNAILTSPVNTTQLANTLQNFLPSQIF